MEIKPRCKTCGWVGSLCADEYEAELAYQRHVDSGDCKVVKELTNEELVQKLVETGAVENTPEAISKALRGLD